MDSDLQSIFEATAIGFANRRSPKRLLLLDYDGTLVPFAPTPELAVPDSELLSLLASLAGRTDTLVHIVSGRCRQTLGTWLGHLPIGLHAEHGYWTRHRPNDPWKARFDDGHDQPWMERASAIIEPHVAAVTGSFIERKTASLAWHFRNADVAQAGATHAALRTALQPLCAAHGLDLLEGVFVLELRQGRVNKGDVVRALVEAHREEVFMIAIGDDVTDEDMFAALPPSALAIAASPRAPSPRHRLDGPRRVRAFLHHLCAAPSSAVRIRCAPAAIHDGV